MRDYIKVVGPSRASSRPAFTAHRPVGSSLIPHPRQARAGRGDVFPTLCCLGCCVYPQLQLLERRLSSASLCRSEDSARQELGGCPVRTPNLSHVTQGPAICTASLDPALRGSHVTASRRRGRDFLVPPPSRGRSALSSFLGWGGEYPLEFPPRLPPSVRAVLPSPEPQLISWRCFSWRNCVLYTMSV